MNAVSRQDFLAGGGVMGELIRAYPWAQTALGPPQQWPQGLRTAVRVLLTTQHPVFIFWGREHICFYNDAYLRSLGPEKHPAMLGARGRDFWEEIWPIIGPQIEQVMRGEGATWHENQLVPIIRHGELQDVYWTYSYGPIDQPDAPHGVGGVLVLCSETTEQTLTSKRLQEERARFVQLFDQAPTFLALLEGPEHVFRFANPGYTSLIGNRPLVGLTVAQALPESAAQGYLDRLDDVYRTGRPFSATGARYTFEVAPGEPLAERYVDFVFQPITDRDGAVTGILVQGVDVTARMRYEVAQKANEQRLSALNALLQEQDRRKDEFIATLSHELRNPLAPIRAAASVMVSPAVTPEQRQKAQVIIQRQVVQMSVLLDDLLDIARITHGKLQLRKDRVALAQVVNAALEAIRPQLHNKQQQLVVEMPDAGVQLDADPVRLAQILTNLLTNASRYSDPGSRVELTGRLVPGELVLSVRDAGIGLAPDALTGIFEMFSQVDGARMRSEGGLGVGLALVKGLASLHGGTVHARSDGPGQGSEFIVRLPCPALLNAGCAGAA